MRHLSPSMGGVTGSRQAPDRAAQRARTRQAIVDAAAALLRTGHQPSVAEAATAAGVHRATAYRYFPTPQSLLADAVLRVGTPDVDEMFRGVDPEDPVALIAAAVDFVSEYMFRQEAMFRNIVRVTVDRWFEQQESDKPDPEAIRQTVRFRWIDHALTPLTGTLPQPELARLRSALTLVMGAEALIATRDVCRLNTDEATDVMRWAATALVRSALADAR